MQISVIVPAFNAETYIEETLDSIVTQTFSDYEVIIVDDGSTDQTGSILERYRNQYHNITVVRQENSGVSAARNHGLKIAKGEFIYFLDSDDILVSDALECMSACAQEHNADLVVANFDYISVNMHPRPKVLESLLKKETADRYSLRLLWSYALGNKLFRKSLIDTYDITFPGITYSEDGVFLMQCIYHSRTIGCLNKVVYHYRKSFVKGHDSATGIPTLRRLEDMLKAHEMIRSYTKIIYPDGNVQGKQMDEGEVLSEKEYMQGIDRREMHFLLEQFYAKYWRLDPELRTAITKQIEEKYGAMSIAEQAKLSARYPEYDLKKMEADSHSLSGKPLVIIALFGTDDRREVFLEALDSLISQNFVPVNVYIPSSMKEVAVREEMDLDHISFIEQEEEELFFICSLHRAVSAGAECIVFNNSLIAYMTNALKSIYRIFSSKECDILAGQIYHRKYGEFFPVLPVYELLKAREYLVDSDRRLVSGPTLGHVVFRLDYLREHPIGSGEPWQVYMERVFRRGFCRSFDEELLRCCDSISKPDMERLFNRNRRDDSVTGRSCPGGRFCPEGAVSLTNPVYTRNQSECFIKMLDLPDHMNEEKLLKKIHEFGKEPVKKQAFFISTRSDGQLDLNAAVLYKALKTRKKKCARSGEHTYEMKCRMIHGLLTSKVIVTDDYNRYLRYFPLKDSQKVIQIWHACGAFKMFGRRGTKLSLKADEASHVQYDLVCVSGPEVRDIYADAFDISVSRVIPSGVPRTDLYYDKKYMTKTKKKIFRRHKNLRNKYIILYAPTFREHTGDRSVFEPELDFGRLSERLPGDSVFVICPHPVMTEKILKKEYENILEIRDISTNDMMIAADVMITDYSSVIFEYALLRKPIVFYCYDLDRYDRGFYLRYPEDLPGDIITSQPELERYLADKDRHVVSEKNDSFIRRYMSACDGNSSRRIASMIESYLKEDGR